MSLATRIEPGMGAAALRWSAVGTLVLAIHLGAGALLLRRTMTAPEREAAAPGIAIDLEPVTVPQDQAVPATAPPPPDLVAAPASAPPEPAAAPTPGAEPTPAPAPEPRTAVAPMPEPEQQAMPPAPAPEPVQAEPPSSVPVPLPPLPPGPAVREHDAVLAPPPPTRRAKPKKVSPPVDRKALAEQKRLDEARAAERAERRDAARQATSAERAERQAAAVEERQQRTVASAGDLASWRGRLAAHLNQFKHAPPGGGDGTARVSFTVGAGGAVSGVRLAGSSGDAALDEAALSMVERANPVPAPPPALGPRIPLTVPVHFSGF